MNLIKLLMVIRMFDCDAPVILCGSRRYPNDDTVVVNDKDEVPVSCVGSRSFGLYRDS